MMRRRRTVLGLEILKRLSPAGKGFLTLERIVARNRYTSGPASPPYRFEVLHRRGVDAVAIIPFHVTRRPRRIMVVLKVGFRPGLLLRSARRPPARDRRRYTFVREAVAGSLEPGDRGERGIDRRARLELYEETGLRPIGRIIQLGAGFFPSHGQSTEKVHLRAFRVDPARAERPPGDGSINEADAGTVVLEAGRILRMCRRGAIEDPKLEIGVTRLCARLGERSPLTIRHRSVTGGRQPDAL
jgi:8-oxo-dGTP pyrophosphatase MutT (NUDIX family)